LINYRNFHLEDTPSLEGKIAVLTGGSDGIGREITAQLLKHDIDTLYILSRTQEKFNDAKEYWIEKHGLREEHIRRRTEFLPCDLSDITAVKKVADGLVSKLHRLDILFLNAGLPPMKEYTLSPQGIENTFSVVVGHFVLTQILLQTIEDSAEKYDDSRIITTSSSFHVGCQELDYNLLRATLPIKSPDALDSCWRYARSKLGTILFTQELAHRLDNHGAMNVFANTFFPGNVPTGAMDTWKDLFGTVPGVSLKGIFEVVGQSAEDGATTGIYLATSEEVKKKELKGKYFIPIAKEGETTKLAKDRDLARNLWYWSDSQVTQVLGKGWEESGNI